MIRHLLKLVWNRKRANGMIILEIFISFLVVFAVLALVSDLWLKHRRPLGFRWENVWVIDLDMGSNDHDWSPEQAARLAALHREVDSMTPVIAVAGSSDIAYDNSHSGYSRTIDDRQVRTGLTRASDGFDAVMQLDLTRGRWFHPDDDAHDWHPVVISESLAREMYGEKDPLGEKSELSAFEGEARVVGVVSDYRKDGEFHPRGNFMFARQALDDAESPPLRRLVVRVEPGTSASFEEELVTRLGTLEPRWSFDLTPMEQMRRSQLRTQIIPVMLLGIVGTFLLLMVALGLTGVLWQNVTQRRQEIGLRRATGADGKQIHRQILLELAIVTTLGLLLGIVTVMQIPVLQIVPLAPGVLGTGLALSMTLIYVLAMVCGLYPSWLATRVQPAEALHYE